MSLDIEFPGLTPRQAEVMALAAEGYSNKEIGVALGIATYTVNATKDAAFKRLGLESRLSLMPWIVKQAKASAVKACHTIVHEELAEALRQVKNTDLPRQQIEDAKARAVGLSLVAVKLDALAKEQQQ